MFLKSQMFFFAFEWFFLILNVLERNSECFIFCEMVRNGIPNFFIFSEMDGLEQNYKRFALSENGNPI
jgi:hypothetical protein